MSGTYNDNVAEPKDKIRAILGDTTTTEWLHTDSHIVAVLTWQGSIDAAVAFLARELIARYAPQPVLVSADGMSQDYSDRLKSWQAIVDRADAALSTDSTGSGAIVMVPADYGADSAADEYARPSTWWP